MLNHITIYGRLTSDPVLRTTQSGTNVVSFTVAVDRDFARDGASDKTDFFNCVAWEKRGEFVERNFKKGNLIVVSGRMQSRKWEDRNSQKRTEWEINVESVYFGGSKKDNDNGSFQPPQAANVSAADFTELEDVDPEDLPF